MMGYRPARESVGCDKANTEKNSNMYFSLYSIVFISLPLEVTFWYSIFVLFQLKLFPNTLKEISM